MNENGKNRKEWVKSVAIVFLSVLLVLTFFSNTIMNYSLPEVAAQYVQSGTITAKIRGTGVIESGDPYSVKISGTRKVESVEVKEGDVVEKGDILCILSAEDSLELEAAKEDLAAAEEAFELALLTGSMDTSVMNNAGDTDSTENYKAKIIRLKNEIQVAEQEVETAQATVDEWQKSYEAFSLQIALSSATSIDTSAEEKALKNAKTVLDNASFALTEARNWLTALESQLDQQMTVSSGDAEAINNLEQQIIKANQSVISAETAYNTASLNYEKAENALDNKRASDTKDTVVANLEKQQAQVQIDLNKAEKNLADKQEILADKQEALSELVQNIQDEISLGSLYDAIEKAQEEVDKLEKELSGCEVMAPIAGTILSVNVKSGLDTPDDGIVFTMQPEGDGYTLSFSVTNDQARRVSVGDIAEPVNAWRYEGMQIVLESIKPDKTNPSQNKLLVFEVTGENVTANQSLNVSVGQKSATYEMIVPNSAIREDNNGKFVLIVESKSSPLGNRYIATRADVEVVASDDTQSAITGAVEGWEFVITTSTKPIEAGQQVRLAEN